MSTITAARSPAPGSGAPAPAPVPTWTSRLRWGVADTLTITKRNLIAYTRIPEALFFSTVQPIMFVLLFRYVFGGAIRTRHLTYVNYLMPGIFVQTRRLRRASSTAIGLADDLQKGLIERFRALPMARSAVLAGRTTADLVRNVFVVLLMTGVGAPSDSPSRPAPSTSSPAPRSCCCSPTPCCGDSRSSACRHPTARRRR